MKKWMLIMAALLYMLGTAAYAEDAVMKANWNGKTYRAKEFGSGNGIEFIVPSLDEPNFYISAVEFAVLEQSETGWTVYTDKTDGTQSKKCLIENPAGLRIQADLGDTAAYDADGMYRLAYRIYATSTEDMSQTTIAGQAEKDGWRLVGEADGITPTDEGLVFYKNKVPTIQFQGLTFQMPTINGLVEKNCSSDALRNTYLPMDSFKNGVRVRYQTTDDDTELIVRYRLETLDREVVGTGMADGLIVTEAKEPMLRLFLIVTDPYGAEAEIEACRLMLDMDRPEISESFDDKGCYITGNTLYSRYLLSDGNDVPFAGTVYSSLMRDGQVIEEYLPLTCENGECVIERTGMPEGDYQIKLTAFDRAGNRMDYTLFQRLDATIPSIRLHTPENDVHAAVIGKWTNTSGTIIADISDSRSGLFQYELKQNGKVVSNGQGNLSQTETVCFEIPPELTGKIAYSLQAVDASVALDKEKNTVKDQHDNINGIMFQVWIDKTAPNVWVEVDEEVWHNAPVIVHAGAEDRNSAEGIDDASGLASLEYCITDSRDIPKEGWQPYNEIRLEQSGVWYVHVRAVDAAGNCSVETKRIKVNTPSVLLTAVRPTDAYAYTIYQTSVYDGQNIYVVKNTAYNTQYTFTVQDPDLTDTIVTTAELVHADDASIYAVSEMESPPDRKLLRDVVFNMPYLRSDRSALPDGVYTLFLTVCEMKSTGEQIVTHEREKACTVMIKRNTPPVPQIEVQDSIVTIIYPEESSAESLNQGFLKELYQRQYKIVLDGQADSNMYLPYITSFEIDKDCVITALYTDPAGNTSITSKRIYSDTDASDTSNSILTDGNTVTVHEGRVSNIYYINTRREKQAGVDNSIFQFMN